MVIVGIVTAGAAVVNLALKSGDSSHVTCDGRLTVANQSKSSVDLRCAASATTTTMAPKAPRRAHHDDFEFFDDDVVHECGSSSAVGRRSGGDPTPPFVACGANREPVDDVAVYDLGGGEGGVPELEPRLMFRRATTADDRPELVARPEHDLLLRAGRAHARGGQFAQIPAKTDTFVGAPGAILDGQDQNDYAFTQDASNVTVEYLEIRHFVCPLDEGVVNHDAGHGLDDGVQLHARQWRRGADPR